RSLAGTCPLTADDLSLLEQAKQVLLTGRKEGAVRAAATLFATRAKRCDAAIRRVVTPSSAEGCVAFMIEYATAGPTAQALASFANKQQAGLPDLNAL
ncbi:unnamed protein product, partial [Chrysoparadoxa australica]